MDESLLMSLAVFVHVVDIDFIVFLHVLIVMEIVNINVTKIEFVDCGQSGKYSQSDSECFSHPESSWSYMSDDRIDISIVLVWTLIFALHLVNYIIVLVDCCTPMLKISIILTLQHS